jgi:hypothetical protein
MIETVSKSMTRQGLESLNAALQARMTAEVEGKEIEYEPPSETEFAASVAKDLAAGIFSPAYQSVWITLAVALIAFVVGFSLGRRGRAERMWTKVRRSFSIPALNFRGTPLGIDVRRVAETGILPRLNTGIAHKQPGIGMVGAGIPRAPQECFVEALEEL